MEDESIGGAHPPRTQPDSSETLPGQHPDVAPDFAFGQLAASTETVGKLIRARNGVYHRGQITTMLGQLGTEPPKSTDLITFHRERAG